MSDLRSSERSRRWVVFSQWCIAAVTVAALAVILGGPAPAAPSATKFKESKVVGTGSTTFRDVLQPPAMLVGLRAGIGPLDPTALTIHSLQPKYLTSTGKVLGTIHGRLYAQDAKVEHMGLFVDVEAKEGYAIGAIVAKAGDRIDGFRVVFMRIRGDRLDPSDKYESRWVGGRGGGAETTLDGAGLPIIGIHGNSSADDLFSVGLIQPDVPAKP
ncbi:MAG: hypothetical protein ABFC96_15305 [Thermoguttaceae bacterium]